LGNGDNKDSLIPVKNQFLDMWAQEKPENKIIKIDCADEYSGALTLGGDLYVWGKNNHGQLGIGSGIGIEMTESEKFPVPVIKTPETKFSDFCCGENGMMILDEERSIYKTGWRIDYVPSIFEITRTIKPKLFFAGKSYYSMIDLNGKIYQWGSLFNQSKAEKTDSDMSQIKKDPFENKDVLRMGGKYTICGAIVRNINTN
jgi:alpha-tubulin suppressor-like RCC1 family protein